MTIDKIYIANFGKLTDLTIVPSAGLNLIYASNGSGKSTLLSFVKYMFYGTKMKKSKGDMPFKEKYMPWNGMPMGGSIEFTHSGKKYIITRSDGAKNGSRKLEVKDLATGTLLNIDDPGHYFFSVGEKAFSDSVFVTDIFSVTDSDDDILTLLSNSGADTASYTRVKAALEEKILSLSSSKRSSSELSVLNRLLGEEQTKQINLKKELNDLTLSRSSFENKSQLLRTELKRLDDIIDAQKLACNNFRHQELCKNLEIENTNLENLNDQLCGDDAEEASKIVRPKFSIVSAIVFPLLSFVSFAFLKNILLGSVFSILVFVSFVLFFVSFAQKKKLQKSESDRICALRETLSEQIELSTKRIDDIKAEISQLEKSNLDIFQNKNLNSHQTNSFTTDELNVIMQNREKCADELKALTIRLESHAKRYSQIMLELDAISFSIDNLNIRISEVHSKLELYRTAMNILDTSFSVLRDEFAPRLCADAFELLSTVSQDDCTGLVSNEHFETSVKINNEYKDVRFLSDGTQALVYIAIRIAMCRYLSPDDAVPIFFDDVLSGFDDTRCLRMMNVLGELSLTRQIFLCTCRSRETIIPNDLKNASLISLRKDDTNGQC